MNSNTEEKFILASLKEFVKLWGSGRQANFQLQCCDGQVAFKFSAQLGAPADRHFVPPNPQHGFHAPPHLHPRRKSQHQRDRDGTRAAAHRAQKTAATAENVDIQNEYNKDSSADEPNPPQEAVPADDPTPPQEAVPADQNPTTVETASADPAAQVVVEETAVPAAPHPPIAKASEVRDEVVEEQSEVKVMAIGLFESCPDFELSDDYFASLRKFVLSEAHLQKNIESFKFARLSSRQLGTGLFEHSVKVEILVKTAELWEPPAVYIRKHLATNDWLKGNKTRITLGNIM